MNKVPRTKAGRGHTNDIPALQDGDNFQTYLRAARARYRKAKRIAILQISATVAVPLSLGIAATLFSALDTIAAAIGGVMLALDTLLLSAKRRTARREGAMAQELFDCGLYELEWNDQAAGDKPRTALAVEWGQSLSSEAVAGLREWYPACVGELPVHAARVVCQKLNATWDSRLRMRYASVVAGGVIAIALALIAYGIAVDPSSRTLMLKVVALVPALVWAVREWKEQTGVGRALVALDERIEGLWKDVLQGAGAEEEALTIRSRAIQDQIFAKRRDGPEVFDWIYNLSRDKEQTLMVNLASEMVNEFNEAEAVP